MENELLKVDFEGIQIVQGLVQFNDYQRIKKEAEDLAEQIKTVDVNEENVKQSKKLFGPGHLAMSISIVIPGKL